ncbi:ran GTPase-activating protein-like, partial [Bombina bombina]
LKLCGILDNIFKTLAHGFRSCQHLEEIILSWNSIGDEGACALATELNHMRKLRILDLEKNQITKQGAESVTQALISCLRIQVVR